MKKTNITVVHKSVNDLIPYVNNARTHSDDQVNQIASSIKEFGFTNPVLVDGDNGIIAGHGRVMAAKKLNMEEVPTIELAHLTDTQKKAYILADNKLALNSGWDDQLLSLELLGLQEADFDLDLIGFGQEEIDEILSSNVEQCEGKTDPDEVPEVTEEPKTKRGDVWVLGNHRLMCGDAVFIDDIDKMMAGELYQLMITDLPYGVNYSDKNVFLNAADNGKRCQRPIINDHKGGLYEFAKSVYTNLATVCDGVNAYYAFMPQGGDQMMMMMALSDSGYQVKHELIWLKNNHVLGRVDYAYKHEPVCYGWSIGGTHRFYGDFQTSIFEFPKPTKSEMHPTMKPVELIERLILNSSAANENVIDPTGGSGSTLIACEKTNRKCYMMELDPHYCDVIINRWQNFTGKDAVLESTGQKYNEIQ